LLSVASSAWPDPRPFAPKRHPHELDKDTSALFHFDGDLQGEGMTENGERYPVRGQAGALELH